MSEILDSGGCHISSDTAELSHRPGVWGHSPGRVDDRLCGVAGEDDPRITNQASYLQGATFEWRSWSSDRPDWDHDHCEFCWVHFGYHLFEDDADTQLEGWATPDGKHGVPNLLR